MNEQINIRFPAQMLKTAKKHAKSNGFSTVQDFIRETVRERLYEKEELKLIEQLMEVTKRKNLYGTEKELMEKLK